MKKLFLLKTLAISMMLCVSITILKAQVPTIQWQKTLGGSGTDVNNFGNITSLKHGNYLIVGETKSVNGIFSSNHGDFDAFVIKFNSSGNVIWAKTYGGSAEEALSGVVENSDGSILLAGYTYSNDGDVSGNHGDRDGWVIKISSNGTLLSQHCYGGTGEDMATGLIKSSGNTFALTGWTNSNDGDVSGNHGLIDAWVLKFNSNYSKVWSKSYGGSGEEIASGLLQSGSNIIIAGFTNSNDGNMNGYHGGDQDAFAMSIKQSGAIEWSKCYGGSGDDYSAFGIGQAKDGNLLIPGTTNSNNGDVTGNHGMFDGWITKVNNNNGHIIWSKCYGTSNSESGWGVSTMSNGDLVLCGISGPSNELFGDNLSNALVVRINKNGNQIWKKTYGGSEYDDAGSAVETGNGEIIVLSYTDSYNGDVTNQHGDGDMWLVKLNDHNCYRLSDASNVLADNVSINVFPNPFSSTTTISISLPESKNVSIQVFDINGKLVSTLSDRFLESGVNLIEFNAENINAGIYFLKIQAGDFMKTERLVITK